MQLNPIYYNEQHIAFADNVRRFVQKEMAPFVNEWDEAETFPRELCYSLMHIVKVLLKRL